MKALWVSLSCAFFMGACSPTATITLQDKSIIEAKIEHSDAENIYIFFCHHVRRYTKAGKLSVAELHCDADPRPEARQTFTYDKKNRLRRVELDICADGTVDRRMTLAFDKAARRTWWKGDTSADDFMSLETIKGVSCPGRSGGGRLGEAAIARKNIEEIDHPGKAAMAFGVPIAAAGWAALIYSLVATAQCNRDTDCGNMFYSIALPGLLGAAFGTALFLSGWDDWSESRDAAAPTGTPKISPVALSDGERTYYGIGLALSW